MWSIWNAMCSSGLHLKRLLHSWGKKQNERTGTPYNCSLSLRLFWTEKNEIEQEILLKYTELRFTHATSLSKLPWDLDQFITMKLNGIRLSMHLMGFSSKITGRRLKANTAILHKCIMKYSCHEMCWLPVAQMDSRRMCPWRNPWKMCLY